MSNSTVAYDPSARFAGTSPRCCVGRTANGACTAVMISGLGVSGVSGGFPKTPAVAADP